MSIKSINVHQLKEMMDKEEDFQLIDVREQHEYDFVNLAAELIPVNSVMENVEKFSKEKKVVVHCRSGARSANAISILQHSFGYDNLYNLEGGILAWAREIDTSLPQY